MQHYFLRLLSFFSFPLWIAGSQEDVDVRCSLLETNGAGAPAEVLKNESLSKRDSYANFEVHLYNVM
jgi:hypothetical protein